MILKNLIYIYQLEQYDKKRFLFFVYKNINWFSISKRGKLVLTVRAKFIFILTILFALFTVIIIFLISSIINFFICLFCVFVAFPIFIILADIVITPFVLIEKKRIIQETKELIKKYKAKGLIVIGITGSFGKTTMKNILASTLKQEYKIILLPGNINTDIGLSQYLLKNKDIFLNAEILIVEMGAYKIGDIKKICDIVHPDYSIITSIGQAHLERFGSFKNIVSAKFEIANATEKKVFLNICDDNVKKYADSNIDHVDIVRVCGSIDAQNIKRLNNFKGILFKYKNVKFQIKLIADYAVDFSIIAIEIGKEIGANIQKMSQGLKKLDFVPHRLQVIRNKKLNRTIIDDSYNGNYLGFIIGLNILKKAKGRKIVLTPGIVELGMKSRIAHTKLAKKYAESIDFILLIKNKNTKYIQKEFYRIGFNSYEMYNSAIDAHKDLANILRAGDTIIFQNDLTDNYL